MIFCLYCRQCGPTLNTLDVVLTGVILLLDFLDGVELTWSVTMDQGKYLSNFETRVMLSTTKTIAETLIFDIRKFVNYLFASFHTSGEITSDKTLIRKWMAIVLVTLTQNSSFQTPAHQKYVMDFCVLLSLLKSSMTPA